MRKMYINPISTRGNRNCFYYSSLGTERHMMAVLRNNYRYERLCAKQTSHEARITVLYLMLADPICIIRKAVEL